MLKTIQLYLTRELVKAMVLALVAFTLVMTVFFVMEPLRKQQGMAPEQVAAIFGYTMPIELSMALPVATLFAATIVYGRFSQDNELLACRASGISAMTLLRPALLLGMVVTACSLGLSNFVAPEMVRISKTTFAQNLKGYAYRQMRTRGYFRQTNLVVHAESVQEGTSAEGDVLGGLAFVYTDPDKPENADFGVAPSARFNFMFDETEGDTTVTISPRQAMGFRTGMGTVKLEEAPLTMALPNPLKEQASWMNWTRLLEIVKDPTCGQQVRKAMERVRCDMLHDMYARQVVEVIQQGKPFRGLSRRAGVAGKNQTILEQYVLTAPKAEVISDADRNPHRYYAQLSGPGDQAVKIEEFHDGKLAATYRGPSAMVEAQWPRGPGIFAQAQATMTIDSSQVTLKLQGPVITTSPANPQQQRRNDFKVGQFSLPPEIVVAARNIDLHALYNEPDAQVSNPVILDDLKLIRGKMTRSMLNGIEAEMHSRVAYSLSCFLMVALGAAAGLIFRGGQFISAFAISAIPGAMVVILLIAGRNMMQGSDAHKLWGMGLIWGGIAALVVANVVAYLRLARR